MDVKLLRKVAEHILAEPRRLVMASWLLKKLYPRDKIDFGFQGIRSFPRCGTAGCIAGWTCELRGKSKVARMDRMARKLLGLSRVESARLFIPDNWPPQFSKGLADDGRKNTAKVAVARIEHFIKTKGRE